MTGTKNLHRFALVTALSTFCLIIAGGLVTSTQSGLSVPDWPNTYGHFMFAYPLDEMVGGIFFEHSHRMIASCVGLLTVILALWLWKREDRRWVRTLGFVAVATVVAQGVLGGITVLFLLPTAISVSHATLAQAFFSIVVTLALVTSSWWRSEHPALAEGDKGMRLSRLAMITTGAVFVQLILGALMRHMHAGLAVPDVPLAYGSIVPPLSPEAVAGYNHELILRDIRLSADDPITATQIVVHLLHRYWAIVAAALIVWTSLRLIALGRGVPRLRTLGAALLALVIVQVALGILTVLSQKAVDLTTAHVATGALLLAGSVLASLHAVRLTGLRAPAPALRFAPRGAAA